MPKPNTSPFPAAPPAKEEEIIPDLRELDLPPAIRHKLGHLIDNYADWGQQKHEAEAAQKPINAEIKNILGEWGIGKAWHGDRKVLYYNSPRRTLSVEKLMENGVSPAVIALCYETKDSYTLRITARGEGKNGED